MRSNSNHWPPHSSRIEQFLLQSILLDGKGPLVQCIQRNITAQAFHVPGHRVIYQTLLTIHAAGTGIELFTLAEELKMKSKLTEVGGYACLVRVARRLPVIGRADCFIGKLFEMQRLREEPA